MEKQNINNIFLTGSTGVVGGRVLYELLLNTDAKIYCLTRANDTQHAFERIANMLFVYDNEQKLMEQLHSRVVPIIGDITKDKFGIDENAYNLLSSIIDRVIHSAANVRLMSIYIHLKPVNVTGTSNVIEFCLKGNIPMLHVSTYSLLGNKTFVEGFVFREDQLDVGQILTEDYSYSRSKLEAELLVRDAGKKGLVWSIVRPGNVFGDSITGAYPLMNTEVSGIYYDFLKTVVETGYGLDAGDLIDMTPVDYVAKSMVYILKDIYRANGKTFHLINPEHKRLADMTNILIECGYKINIIPYKEYIDIIKKNRLIWRGKRYSSPFTTIITFATDEVELAVYDTTQIREFLKDSGIKCPSIDSKLMNTYIDYCVKVNYLPARGEQIMAEILPPKGR